MKVVIIRLLCAAIVLVAIAITYVVLQAFGKKGIKIFNNGIIRWILSYVVGLALFLIFVNIIFS